MVANYENNPIVLFQSLILSEGKQEELFQEIREQQIFFIKPTRYMLTMLKRGEHDTCEMLGLPKTPNLLLQQRKSQQYEKPKQAIPDLTIQAWQKD